MSTNMDLLIFKLQEVRLLYIHLSLNFIRLGHKFVKEIFVDDFLRSFKSQLVDNFLFV